MITKAAGGVWDRASDPVVAWGPDGKRLPVDPASASTARARSPLSRSTDGGKTFGPPVYAHYSVSCNYSDDKNGWSSTTSSTARTTAGSTSSDAVHLRRPGQHVASPQAAAVSDDKGKHWSDTTYVSATNVEPRTRSR